jgi:hypothetical protein
LRARSWRRRTCSSATSAGTGYVTRPVTWSGSSSRSNHSEPPHERARPDSPTRTPRRFRPSARASSVSPIASSEARQTPATWCKTHGCADKAPIAARCGTPSRFSPPPRLDSRSTSPNRPEHDARSTSTRGSPSRSTSRPTSRTARSAPKRSTGGARAPREPVSHRTSRLRAPRTVRLPLTACPPALHGQARRRDDHERALLARLAGLPPPEPRPGSSCKAQPKLANNPDTSPPPRRVPAVHA